MALIFGFLGPSSSSLSSPSPPLASSSSSIPPPPPRLRPFFASCTRMPLCTTRDPLLHCLVNAVFTAVGIPADGSAKSGPAPLNLQMSWTLSQSPRVRLYASITSITSAIPSFSFPPIAADRMGAVMSILSRGRYPSRSAAPSALKPSAPPALVACAWISCSSRLFFPWVEFLPSHPGNRLKLRSPGKDPNVSREPRSRLAGVTDDTMLA